MRATDIKGVPGFTGERTDDFRGENERENERKRRGFLEERKKKRREREERKN